MGCLNGRTSLVTGASRGIGRAAALALAQAVAPGVVETGMSSVTKAEAGRDAAVGMQALKRIAQPGDIAGAIAFLASAQARWVTGDTQRMDGGSKL